MDDELNIDFKMHNNFKVPPLQCLASFPILQKPLELAFAFWLAQAVVSAQKSENKDTI